MEHDRPLPPLDRRPLYPERVTVDVPRGFSAKLRRVAESQGTSVNAVIRAALLPVVEPYLARDLAALDNLPSEQREQALDIAIIKHGATVLAFAREAAIDQAENVVRLEEPGHPKAGA